MPLRGRKRLQSTTKRVVKRKKDLYRGVIVDGYNQIITATPVDTGAARANWFVTEKRPSDRKEPQKRSIEDANSLPRNITGKVFLTNNLPYIEVLEYGLYSRKSKTGKTRGGYSVLAPKMWVRKTVRRMRKAIKLI